MELRPLPLAQLTLQRPTARKADDDVYVEKCIGQHGILKPLMVCPLAPSVFEVVDGERRVAFARRLVERGRFATAFQVVPCFVLTLSTPAEKALWRLVSNLHTGLPSGELAQLSKVAGDQAAGWKAAGSECTDMDAVTRINDVLHGLVERRNGIRSARRIMDVLAITRDYVMGGTSLQDAMDALRFASTDD